MHAMPSPRGRQVGGSAPDCTGSARKEFVGGQSGLIQPLAARRTAAAVAANYGDNGAMTGALGEEGALVGAYGLVGREAPAEVCQMDLSATAALRCRRQPRPTAGGPPPAATLGKRPSRRVS